jgi:hypothetical protein
MPVDEEAPPAPFGRAGTPPVSTSRAPADFSRHTQARQKGRGAEGRHAARAEELLRRKRVKEKESSEKSGDAQHSPGSPSSPHAPPSPHRRASVAQLRAVARRTSVAAALGGALKRRREASAASRVKVEHAKHAAHGKAARRAQGRASRVGLLMLELFVSKIVLMMLVLLCLSALLDRQPDVGLLFEQQLETRASLRLDAPPAPAAFNRSLARVTECVGTDSAFALPPPCAMMVKIAGEVVYPPAADGDGYAAEMDARRPLELLLVRLPSDARDADEQLVCELSGAGRAGQARDNSVCATVMALDLREGRRAELEAQIWLTLVICGCLILGMLLIAADMQRHLLNPIERLTKIIKIVTGRHWRKKLEEMRGQAKKKMAAGGKVDGGLRAGALMDELELEAYTVCNMLRFAMDDLEALYGMRMGRHRQRLWTLEHWLDKFFMLASRVLHDVTDGEATFGHLTAQLRQYVWSELPASWRRQLTERTGRFGRLRHVWDMFERPRAALYASAEGYTLEQLRLVVGPTPAVLHGQIALADLREHGTRDRTRAALCRIRASRGGCFVAGTCASG